MSLTEDDKHWMSSLLDTKLEALETRIDTKLEALETRIDTKLEALETRIDTKFDTKLEALETRMLRAFHDWASPVDMRARSHAAAIRALDIEVESLGTRVAKLEPPH